MTMTRTALAFLFASFYVVFSAPVVADPAGKEHAHKTPHGGVVQEVEGMHAEFLIDKAGQPQLYFFDKNMKPLDRSDFQMRLTVKGHDGAQHSRELKATKDAKGGTVYKGEPIERLSDWDTAVVSLKLRDKWTHVRFSHH